MPYRTIRAMIEGQENLNCAAETTVFDAARLMEHSHNGAVMVVDDGRLIGIFTERDALFRVIASGRDARTTRIVDVMTPTVCSISPDRPFGHALYLMYVGGFRHVPVVEDGRPIGMISVRDALGPELEDYVYEWLRQEELAQIHAQANDSGAFNGGNVPPH